MKAKAVREVLSAGSRAPDKPTDKPVATAKQTEGVLSVETTVLFIAIVAALQPPEDEDPSSAFSAEVCAPFSTCIP